MKLFVIVVNGVRWVRFFADYADAYQYLHSVLPETLKTDGAFYDGSKTYFRNGRLFSSYRNILMQKNEKHVYSIEETSLINVLNWLAEDKENQWIRQYLISEE